MNHSINDVFTLNPDIKTEDALIFACDYLKGVAAIVYETAENTSLEYRPLARSAIQQLDVVQEVIGALATRSINPA
jgi:hypothetical protein